MGSQNFYLPGQEVEDSRVTDHRAFHVLYTGHGRQGVIISCRDDGTGGYAVWLIDVTGNLILTMRTDDHVVALGSFENRVVELLRWARDPGSEPHLPAV